MTLVGSPRRGSLERRSPELDELDEAWTSPPSDVAPAAVKGPEMPRLAAEGVELPAPVDKTLRVAEADEPATFHAEMVPPDPAAPREPMMTVPPPTNYVEKIRTARRPAFNLERAVTPRQTPRFIPPAARPSLPAPHDLVPYDAAFVAPPVPAPRVERAEPEELDVVVPSRSPFLSIALAVALVAALGLAAFVVRSRSAGQPATSAPLLSPSTVASPLASARPLDPPSEPPANSGVALRSAAPRASAPPTSRVVPPPVRGLAAPSVVTEDPPSLPRTAAPPPPPPATAAPHPAPRASGLPPGMEFLKHDL